MPRVAAVLTLLICMLAPAVAQAQAGDPTLDGEVVGQFWRRRATR